MLNVLGQINLEYNTNNYLKETWVANFRIPVREMVLKNGIN
jgi:hypothetical protein